MKNTLVSFLAFVVLITLLASCVSLEDRQMTWQERSEANIAGTVSAEFTTFQWFHIPARERLKQRAHRELMAAARQQFSGNVGIRNITIVGSGSGWSFLQLPILLFGVAGTIEGAVLIARGYEGVSLIAGTAMSAVSSLGNFQRITVTGDVVLFGEGTVVPVENAVNYVAATLIESMPHGANIAILNIESDDIGFAETIMAQLEFRLFMSRNFTIVDRARLDQIREEQHLHLSGEVNDLSAAFIGHLLGASIVITGSTGRDATGGWLLIRALDVTTAQVISMAMGRF
ncbi:MAG: CsgG/HfaB family protein [Treponema sp.]|nr:CsgG/HfaB family protein [Treponema sp.]